MGSACAILATPNYFAKFHWQNVFDTSAYFRRHKFEFISCFFFMFSVSFLAKQRPTQRFFVLVVAWSLIFNAV